MTRQQALDAHRAGKLEEALPLYTRSLAEYPDDAAIWSNFGVLLRAMGLHDRALMAQEKAHALRPGGVASMSNFANILSDLGDYDRSLKIRHALLKNAPNDPAQKTMIGRGMRGQGRYDDAITWLQSHAPDHPNDPEFDMQFAFAHLARGDYAEGFRCYQSRWFTDEITPRSMAMPEWQGEDLTGKRLCVLPEQGFGDTILFSRFLPAAQASGARVAMLAEPPLARLLQEADVDELWHGQPKDNPPDAWVNLVDLAKFHFDANSVVPPPPNLHLPAQSIARASEITEPFAKRFKVGVNWTGSQTYRGNAFRSFEHSRYLGLVDLPNLQMFSLYKGPALDAFQSDGSSAFIVDAGASDEDFADCAALMDEMDLIITSDTATAHIAGTLGLPVWVLLHWDPFWVFGHDGDKTEWYPSMRLYRQDDPGDWDSVFAQVRGDLEGLVNG